MADKVEPTAFKREAQAAEEEAKEAAEGNEQKQQQRDEKKVEKGNELETQSAPADLTAASIA